MDAAAKIRWLLATVCLGLFLTAIIAKRTYSPANNLSSSAKTLEGNLQQKERIVNGYINDRASFFKLKNVTNDESFALGLVEMAHEQKIYVATFDHGQLSYWSGVRVLPNSASDVAEGRSFLKEANGYYEAIKKTEGEFSAIFYIPVKNNYSYQNPYLQNVFAPDLLQDDNVEIADFTDRNIYAVHAIDHHYLFSLKLKANDLNHTFQYTELLLWFSAYFLLCILTNIFANYVNKNGHVQWSLLIIGVFIIGTRFVSLYYQWPDIYAEIPLFDASYYHSGWLFPSEGDLLINMLLLGWFSLYIYNSRDKIIQPIKSRKWGYVICIGCIFLSMAFSKFMLNLASTQVLNSKINFNVNNVLDLSVFSMVGLLILCIGFFIFVLLAQTFLSISLKLNISHLEKLYVLLSIIGFATLSDVFHHDYSFFYLLLSLIVVLMGYVVFYAKSKFDPLIYIGILIICSFISSVKLYDLESIKETGMRKQFAQQLVSEGDTSAEKTLSKLEHRILDDKFLVTFFEDHTRNPDYLQTRFQKLYFGGYLTNFDLKTYEYGKDDVPLPGINNNNSLGLGDFKSLVMYSVNKIGNTRYFYRATDLFGSQNYFAIIPIYSKSTQIGTLVIDLKSKDIKGSEPFPELLVEGRANQDDDHKDYSYAFYGDGKLLSQHGKYIYSLANYSFEGKPKQYVYKTTQDISSDGTPIVFSHLIYELSDRKLVVVSKEIHPLYTGITSLTFFFLVFLIFNLFVIAFKYFWAAVKEISSSKGFKWGFWHNIDKVLYKTRIQVSMVFAVVITLIIIGVLTFLSVKSQYIDQQDSAIRDKISRMTSAFNKTAIVKNTVIADEATQIAFNSFADTYSADLTFFNTVGKEVLTTQPNLYLAGLIEPRINAKAFIYLTKLQKSGFINPETIGTLNYKAAYAPVINSKNQEVLGYLQLPYFSNETEYREHIGAFLNTMINVYALVFVAIGLFAIAVARQITTPLTIIQQSLSKTMYGRKNEPIKWQHNDEIGALIKEYNTMIAALEDSAHKLAESERENAWREMAKQVAHEIKNPLTPLKLGLQLLERAWKDKDTKFDEKFERFSRSFVEQIDSLARIASEFSNFAKMPETHLERIDIFEALSQAVDIFKQAENFDINYTPSDRPFYVMADKDQILRSFNNLLKNSIEAIPADRKGLVEISYTVKPREVFIQVKDNGNGIPDALLDRIFVPNFTTKTSGTGLGLALVKNAINYAGGSITFDTKIGEGTTFYISFPEAI